MSTIVPSSRSTILRWCRRDGLNCDLAKRDGRWWFVIDGDEYNAHARRLPDHTKAKWLRLASKAWHNHRRTVMRLNILRAA